MSSTGYFEYNMRTVVHSAWGGVIRIPALLQGLGARRVLLISDVGLKRVGIVDRVAATFETMQSGTAPILAGIYTDIEPDAGSASINKCLEYARLVAADAILAVGGGSVLDASKAVKYALHHQLLDIGEARKAATALSFTTMRRVSKAASWRPNWMPICVYWMPSSPSDCRRA